MPEFKVYCLDDDGHIVKRVDIACADDLRAFSSAYQFSSDYSVEVWHTGRKLYVIAKGACPPKALRYDNP